jgi:hypothetical protein
MKGGKMQLERGDVIKRPGPWGTDHLGLFAGFDQLGRGWVIHNAKDERVKWDLLEAFAAGSPVSLVRRAVNVYEIEAIFARAQELLGRQFDLVNFNCEHFVTVALAGKAASPQLLGVAVGLTLVAALSLLATSSVGS